VGAPPPSPERIVVWLLIVILIVVLLAVLLNVLDVHT
jgi:hypothetical protein